MSDYKETLNLPKTKFPMKANLAQREPQFLQHWEKIGLYQQLREQGCQRDKRFIVHDGPPYANGRPHLGTALNKTLKDIIVKSKTLSGFDAPFVPGWDCHGLPIELNVEKKKGKPGHKLSPKAFREACRQYAKQQIRLQMADFQRLGVLADWQHPYLTMDFHYEADTIRALGAIAAQGHLQRGYKPVHWCTECCSALAEAEVEYREKSSPSIYVRFDAEQPQALLQRFGVTASDDSVTSIPIWTTTPWTLPANQAVCLHPNFTYSLIKCQHRGTTLYLVLAQELVSAVMQSLSLSEYELCGTCQGADLADLLLQHPFLDRTVPVVLGEHVTTESGTGNVHTAPAHGQEDYVVGQRYQLPVDNPVDSRSCFHKTTPLVGGMSVFAANEIVITHLDDKGKLLHQSVCSHSYPHCWRHKTPLIFRATPQWFIGMDNHSLRQQALAEIKKTRWFPSWGESRIENMVAGRPDWCISRQRTWGIPLALFVHKESGELHPDTATIIEKVALLVQEKGVDAWYDVDAAQLIAADATDYEKITDTLDVWFDSGVSHYAVLQQRESEGLRVPADLYLEGSDQHRGWFQSALLTAVAIRKHAPFQQVLTHGYVVDGKGFKMSKSLGNVVSPDEVIKTLGADVLRLWVASGNHAGDMHFSQEILQRSADAYRRIRNTARFLLSNLNDFNPEQDQVSVADMVELDRWAIVTTQALQQKLIAAYDAYHFQTVYQLLHNFCSVEMGSFYLDIIKDRQYTAKKTSIARRSAQTALYHIVQALVRWIAPILSFTAEEIWQQLPGQQSASVFLSQWWCDFPAIPDTAVDQHWSRLMMVRDEVNKLLEARRHAGDIGAALDAQVIFYANQEYYALLSPLKEELRFVLITSEAKVLAESEATDEAISVCEGLRIAINVSSHPKCARCWQRCEDIGVCAEHADICGRCVENVIGSGEVREFA